MPKKGNIPWNKGLKGWTEGTNSGFQKGNNLGSKRKITKHTEETKIKIGKKNKGKVTWNKVEYEKELLICKSCNKEFKPKKPYLINQAKFCSHRCYGEFIKGLPRPWNGGEKSNFWKGGISNNLYPHDWTETLRESIRQRDDYICQECEIHQDELKLAVHHIDYDKQNCNPENLISLCKSCHIKTNYNREYWINYFKTKTKCHIL
jgi:hypothetical protein